MTERNELLYEAGKADGLAGRAPQSPNRDYRVGYATGKSFRLGPVVRAWAVHPTGLMLCEESANA